MKIVFVVMAEWGKYDDHATEVVIIFEDQRKADIYANEQNEEAKKKRSGIKYSVIKRELA